MEVWGWGVGMISWALGFKRGPWIDHGAVEDREHGLVSKCLISQVQKIDGLWHTPVITPRGGRGWRTLSSRPAGLYIETWVRRRRYQKMIK